jgi:hypothetical protein
MSGLGRCSCLRQSGKALIDEQRAPGAVDEQRSSGRVTDREERNSA